MPRITKRKRNDDEIKQPLLLPDCQVDPNEVWYSPDQFLIQIHDLMIERYGGFTGLDVGLDPYHHFIEQARIADGIYRKAAILLREIATSRIFQDGHHRTAYIVTKTFLEKNDAVFREIDEQKIIRFIKDIRAFTIEDIEAWLRNGEL